MSLFEADVTISQEQDEANRPGGIKQQNPPPAAATELVGILSPQHCPAELAGSLESYAPFTQAKITPTEYSYQNSNVTGRERKS